MTEDSPRGWLLPLGVYVGTIAAAVSAYMGETSISALARTGIMWAGGTFIATLCVTIVLALIEEVTE